MYVLGAVFIILGLLGFTQNPVLGLFQVNVVLSLIHIVSGILALVFAARGENQARLLL